ncbi:hypothetical protein SPIRO4BDMA_70043 [uncultured spirochete]|uniref:Uncharacterized protein n=1 Tax=uncultured spirochete TaxID=156406 RepID=A0A3P3XTK3_9SPIR|nr:hypothetical protein SPIRO4BDMA_70043 [uncultured spirochete]
MAAATNTKSDVLAEFDAPGYEFELGAFLERFIPDTFAFA